MTTILDDTTLALYQDIAQNPKVPMTLRVGVAGPRYLSSDDINTATQALSNISTAIAKTLKGYINESPIAKAFYDVANYTQPTLRFTSSLAIGADRLSMSSEVSDSLKNTANCEYAGILPFLLEQCEMGFSDEQRSTEQKQNDWQELNSLANQIKQQDKARLIELDGDISTPESRDQAHYRCAEYLVENIDLLIVITKDKTAIAPLHHKAGTATTMQLAHDAGRPVIEMVLRQDNQSPEIRLHQAKRFGRDEAPEKNTDENLERMLSRIVLFGSLFKLDESRESSNTNAPASITDKQKQLTLISAGLQTHISDKSKLTVTNTKSAEVDFDYQGPIRSEFSITDRLRGGRFFKSFTSLMSNKKQISDNKEEMQKLDECEDFKSDSSANNAKEAHTWFSYFLRADSLAIRYASIHRSTYLLIYLFAAAALITAASAMNFQNSKGLVSVLIGIESVILALIFILYKQDHHNHHRWLQNRCLAEAIRPNIYLSQFGRCFSFFTNRSSDEFMHREVMGHNQSGAQWVCIQAELVNRHIGFGHCRYSQDAIKQSTQFLKSKWLEGQIAYHRSNAASMQSIGKRFTTITHVLFWLTVGALAIKAILFITGNKGLDANDEVAITWLNNLYMFSTLGTAVFPILGTAIFAIRNHSEFDISSQRSLTMRAFFKSIRNAIFVKQGKPSQLLDKELNRLTEVSAKEVSDWLEIYEVKESEPG
ncbi:hypothetical protein L0668_05515 [Paraglaciecola aquimarina]|uniref:SMODS and SLOG-associating 2TM effector domain-containing protein n=1 Tax=Paraglaciecola algarum TaxID=3050085 RepID=A0ABS9D6A5_9ALTE|nr:hypothetical protein [Paraglaciecola sp. G1-23]MCF2947557.1 hypothetical protein [Paraglaciecola sp. G1-23]